MFADDSVLVSKGYTPREASQGLAKKLELVTNYFKSWNVLLNAGKTKIMRFDRLVSGKNLYKFEKVFVNNVGLKLCQNLNISDFVFIRSFSHQVNYCVKQVHPENPDYRTSLLIFKSMVLPYLEYGNSFLLTCTQRRKLRVFLEGLKIALNKGSMYCTKLQGL